MVSFKRDNCGYVSIGARTGIAMALGAMCLPSAHAQVVTITFGAGPAPVPLPFWLAPSLAVVLMVAAYNALGRFRATKVDTSIRVTILVLALAGTFAVPFMRDARAGVIDVFQLLASPARYQIPPLAMFNMIQSGSGYGFAVENDTGASITITGKTVEDPNGWLFFYLPAAPVPTPECTIGLVLINGDKCYIWVASAVHW